MKPRRKRSQIEKLDEQITELEQQLKANPQDENLKEALIELKSKQFSVLHRNIQVLDEFIRNERENNFD